MTFARCAALLGAAAMAAAAALGTAGTASAAPAPAAPAPAAPAPAPAAAPAPAPAAPSPTPCAATAKACVDLSAHRAWLTDGRGHLVRGPVNARGGRSDSATPVGTFSVQWKDADHLSRQFRNAPMPNSVFFYPGVAFHAGNPSTTSNGCIHLGKQSAKAFYDGLRPGDQVQVIA